MLAPLIVFAYNRPYHLDRTLNALSKNTEAKDSCLYIFIDGPKKTEDENNNEAVAQIAETYAVGHQFRNVEIIRKTQNQGLAVSVISGVSEVISAFGRVIVTEDDSVSSPNYLRFMNNALDYYCSNPKIWSIGGYTVPMMIPDYYSHDVIITQRSSSYAWATWKDRWNLIDWGIKDYNRFHWDFKMRKQFNAWGDDRSSMLDDQMLGRVNSWAIRFDYAMFKHEMYNVIPRQSLIQNIGHDGSGTHSTVASTGDDMFTVTLRNELRNYVLTDVAMDEQIRKEFVKPFRVKKQDSVKRFLGNIIIGCGKHG